MCFSFDLVFHLSSQSKCKAGGQEMCQEMREKEIYKLNQKEDETVEDDTQLKE